MSKLSDLPGVHSFSFHGAWREQVVINTMPGSGQFVAEAVGVLYEEFGRESPWIVRCSGLFELAALVHIMPKVLASDCWAEVSQTFRRDVFPQDNWDALWERIFYEVIEPLLIEAIDSISIEFQSPENSRKLVSRIRNELTRRLRHEAREPDNICQLIAKDLEHGGVESKKIRQRAMSPHRYPVESLQNQIRTHNDERKAGVESHDTTVCCLHLGVCVQISMNDFSALNAKIAQEVHYTAWSVSALEQYILRRMVDKPQPDPEFDAWAQLAKNSSAVYLMDGLCFVADKPVSVVLDHRSRPHNEKGPAVLFRDGFAIYAFSGITAQKYTIEDPDSVTPEMILNVRNAEMRRVLLNRFGLDHFVEQGHARLIHTDEFGELYSLDEWLRRPRIAHPERDRDFFDEPIRFVRVRNSTPEPDGTYKYYALRVPPRVVTAREGVAWTFGLEENEYQPSLQT